jgi:predicted alpha/beta-fold hydrolase
MLATLKQFDDAITAPVHGFVNAEAYYAEASSIRYLQNVQIDTLLLNAADDPFLPPEVLGDVRRIADRNMRLYPEFPSKGGHAGFVSGWNPFRPVYYLERRVGEFLATQFAV